MKMSVFASDPAASTARAPVVPIRPDPLRQLLDYARLLVTDAVAASSARIYAGAIDEFIAWAVEGNRPLTKATVQGYKAHLEAQGLAPSTINVRLSAVRRLAAEA